MSRWVVGREKKYGEGGERRERYKKARKREKEGKGRLRMGKEGWKGVRKGITVYFVEKGENKRREEMKIERE